MTQPERRRIRIDGTAPRRGGPTPAAATPVAVDDEPSDCTCPRLDHEDWDEVESDWSDITFVRASTNAVLGVPVGYDSTRSELFRSAERMGATVPEDAMLLMGAGKFRRPVMLEIENVPAGARHVQHPGGFVYTRLLPAPWGEMQTVVDQAKEAATAKYGRKPDDVWVWYLTCRQCSKERKFETLILSHYREHK